jgi:V-type H+-transporting ATPase subunit H
MERYEREVESGMLRWSAVHSTEFWRENVRQFEVDNFRLIRMLAKVLEDSVDNTSLAVACYDLGEFARYHTHGRMYVCASVSVACVAAACVTSLPCEVVTVCALLSRSILDKLRIKVRVMSLLKVEDPELKRQALLCCSKMMVSNWQFVESGGATTAAAGSSAGVPPPPPGSS